MAVIPSALTGAIMAAGNAIYPGSLNLPKVATAVGNAVPSWLPIPTNVLTQGVTAGTVGVGTANGKMVFLPTGQVVAAFSAAGLTGPAFTGLATAVETGTASTLNSSAQYSGTSAAVGAGTDATKITLSNPATLIALMLSNLAAVGVLGPIQAQLATALGNGISTLVQTGFGFGAVAGPSGPIPAAGTSVSLVF